MISGLLEYCFDCDLLLTSTTSRHHRLHARTLIDAYQYIDLQQSLSQDEERKKRLMPTEQPHVTIEAHPDDWQSILSAVLQTISVVGPFIIQLVSTSERLPAKVTVHGPVITQGNADEKGTQASQ